MFKSPFPKSVSFVAFSGDVDPALSEHEEEAKVLSPRASEQRQGEFLRGRFAAHRALKKLGLARPPAIGKGAARQPLWPEGIVGSISHSGDWAVAAVARESDVASIGIDLELATRVMNFDISTRIASSNEIAWVQQDEAVKRERTVTLFSAKESIYKAFFPLCGKHLRFRDVELVADSNDGTFHGSLQVSLPGCFPKGYEFEVSSAILNDYVLTSILLPREKNE